MRQTFDRCMVNFGDKQQENCINEFEREFTDYFEGQGKYEILDYCDSINKKD